MVILMNQLPPAHAVDTHYLLDAAQGKDYDTFMARPCSSA